MPLPTPAPSLNLPLPAGLYVQAWTGAHDYKRLGSAGVLAACKDVGAVGVLWHAGPRAGVRQWPSLAKATAAAGLLPLAAWGLDGHDDVDGTELTALEKAACMAEVANSGTCVATVMDGEIAQESSVGHANSLTMTQEFRRLSPKSYVVHQPWAWPAGHGSFPYETFADAADAVAPQDYWNAFKSCWGRDRYVKGHAKYVREWAALEAARLVSKPGRLDPRFETIEGYGHDDLPWGLADYLLTHLPTRPVFVWCEPVPTPMFTCVVAGVRTLLACGQSVREWQTAWNAKADAGKQLGVDGKLGRDVLRAMGLRPPV